MLGSDWLKRDVLTQHSLEMRQFIDCRESRLPNGNRIIHAHNSSGLTFTVLPDRGLDLWSAHYNGVPLTWLSPGSPRPPAWGQPWLREFNGGLLTTCGLTHVGPPEQTPITEGGGDLHGLYTKLQAYGIAISGGWDDDDRYRMTINGTVSESTLFGEQLRLERTYHLTLGDPAITWTDTITNAGSQRTPLMLLYHINLGYPLVRAGTQLDIASDVHPRDDDARSGAARWAEFDAATPDHREQVYFHRVRMGADGIARAAMLQDTFGVIIEWDTRAMPYVTHWKNTRQGIYVSGIEPGNCIPEGQIAARESGRLVWSEPGDSLATSCTLRVLDGADAVQAARQQIAADRDSGAAVDGIMLDDYPQL